MRAAIVGLLLTAACVGAQEDPIAQRLVGSWRLAKYCQYERGSPDVDPCSPMASMAEWLRFESDDYGWMARRLASSHVGRVVVFLEGGYDLGAIAGSSAATVRGLAGEDFDRPSGDSPRAAWQMLSLARDEAARHWSVVQGG